MVEGYRPYVVEVRDQAALDSDIAACRRYAEAYHRPVDAGGVGSHAATSAAANAAGAAINPLVPVIGGLGGAGAEVITDLDMAGVVGRKIFVKCLDRKGERSGAYLSLDPAN